jgi:hypothetical protein
VICDVKKDIRTTPLPQLTRQGVAVSGSRARVAGPGRKDRNMSTALTPIGTTFRTGERNPVSGVFACVRCEQSSRQNTIPLSKGEVFPPCSKCNAAATWRLQRYA